MSFPRWMYHAELEPKVANSHEHEMELRKIGFAWHSEIFATKPEKTYREHMAEWESKEEKCAEPVVEEPKPKKKRGKA